MNTPSAQINCTTTLSSSIGPDHSALTVTWMHNNQSINASQMSPAASVFTSSFTSVQTLLNISQSDEGQYCCSASFAGLSTESDCIDIQVTGT